MSEQQTETLVELFIPGAVTVPELQSSKTQVTRAEMAIVRHLRRLHDRPATMELSPAAWLEAMSSGWLSPDAEKALRERVAVAEKSEAALREHHDWLTGERELAQATIDELRQQIVSLNAEIRADRTRIPSPPCMASRSIWTRL